MRGQSVVGLPLTELVGIILVAALFISIGAVVVKHFFGTNATEEAASISNMFSLAAKIRDAVKNHEPFVADNPLLYVDSNSILVGFNSAKGRPDNQKQNEVPAGYCKDEWKYPDRPAECGDSACLCLYHNPSTNTGLNKGDQPKACAQLPGVDYVLSFWYNLPLKSKTLVRPSTFPGINRVQDVRRVSNTFMGQCYPWVHDVDTPNGKHIAKYVSYLPPYIFTKVEGTSVTTDTLNNVKNEILSIFSLEDETVPSSELACGAENQNQANVNQYASLTLYGSCNEVFGDNFGLSEIYLEKAVLDGTTYILVGYPITDYYLQQRKAGVYRDFSNTELKTADVLANAGDHANAILHYKAYLDAVTNSNDADKNEIATVKKKLYGEYAALTTSSSLSLTERATAYRYLLDNYDKTPDALAIYNDANTQLSVLCNQARTLIECAGVPVVETEPKPEAGQPCVGTMQRCKDGNVFSCTNSVWSSTVCDELCTNVYRDNALKADCA
jgi:hypothetical protein